MSPTVLRADLLDVFHAWISKGTRFWHEKNQLSEKLRKLLRSKENRRNLSRRWRKICKIDPHLPIFLFFKQYEQCTFLYKNKIKNEMYFDKLRYTFKFKGCIPCYFFTKIKNWNWICCIRFRKVRIIPRNIGTSFNSETFYASHNATNWTRVAGKSRQR